MSQDALLNGPVRTVLYTLPDFGVGGGQTILLRTIEAIEAGHPRQRNIVVGIEGGPMLERFEAAGIRCEVLGVRRPHQHPAGLLRLARLARRERVDLVCSLNTPLDRSYAQVVASALRLPVAVWFMSVAIPLIGFPPPRGRELAFGKRLALYPFNWVSARRVDTLMSLSRSVTSSFAEHLRLHPDSFELVPPGLPASFYEPPHSPSEGLQLRRHLGVEDADPLLMCVGMLIDLKGQHHLVPMMANLAERLPDARLLLVGDGENRAALAVAVEQSGLSGRVFLIGHRQDVPNLLAVSDGLISASRSEGFGMAVLEAMAAGKPVVAVHTPAFEEFAVPGVTARFVERQDAGLLADAVFDVFGDAERARAMGAAARERAEDFRVERTAARVVEVFERTIGGRAGARGEQLVRKGPGAGLRLGPGPASGDYRKAWLERPVQEALVARLTPGAVVFDVGANVGYFSMLAARTLNGAGCVHAFEPVSWLADAARANAARNGLQVEVHECAIGSADGRAELAISPHPGGAVLTSADRPADAVGTATVEVRSLDSLCAAGLAAPTLVKIDVEGAEHEVIEGMSHLLDTANPILIVEVDAATVAEVERKSGAIQARLEERGYRVERLADGYPGQDWKVVHLVAER